MSRLHTQMPIDRGLGSIGSRLKVRARNARPYESSRYARPYESSRYARSYLRNGVATQPPEVSSAHS
jgi:hypothetical protein